MFTARQLDYLGRLSSFSHWALQIAEGKQTVNSFYIQHGDNVPVVLTLSDD